LEAAAEVARSRNPEHHLCKVVAATPTHSSPSPPRSDKRRRRRTGPPKQRWQRRLLKQGLVPEACFTVSYLISTAEPPSGDSLTRRRHARLEEDPRLPPYSQVLAQSILIPSPPWTARGGRDNNQASRIQGQQTQILYMEIPRVGTSPSPTTGARQESATSIGCARSDPDDLEPYSNLPAYSRNLKN
jgi:hypothetical protein